MENTLTILPEKDWLTTAEVAKALGKSERVIQQMAKDGFLKWKLAGSPYPPNARLYDARDVRKHLPVGPRPEPAPSSIARREARRRAPVSSGAEVMVVKEMGTMMREVMEKMALAYQQQREADRDAEVKRLEYEKQRWETERAERLLREKSWLTPQECYRLQGLPARAVKELAEQGKLDGVRVGNGWRIRRASLEAFAG